MNKTEYTPSLIEKGHPAGVDAHISAFLDSKAPKGDLRANLGKGGYYDDSLRDLTKGDEPVIDEQQGTAAYDLPHPSEK